MRRTYRVPLARAGLAGLLAMLVLLAQPGTSIAGSSSESTRGAEKAEAVLLVQGAGFGSPQQAERVRALQRKLHSLGWRPGQIDGLYGPRTEAAVVRFQAAAGVPADGVVGPRTQTALQDARRRALQRGAGYAAPDGSRRVRVLQRELRRRGVRPGPVDGRFGPRTEAAVARLQRAVRLTPDGVVDARTQRVLASAGDPVRRVDNRPAPRNRRPTPETPATGLASADTVDPASVELAPAMLLAALALLIGAVGGLLLSRQRSAPAGSAVSLNNGVIAEGQARSRSIGRFSGQVHALVLGRSGLRRTHEARYLVSDPSRSAPIWVGHGEVDRLVAAREEEDEQPEAEPAVLEEVQPAVPDAPTEGVHVLGYVSVRDTNGQASVMLRSQAADIDALCEQRGWHLLELVRDVEGENVKGFDRPGLIYALERIGQGEAACLVVSHLERLSRSIGDLGRILEWLDSNEGRLVAIDVGLDTASREGQMAAQTLISVGEWERRRLADRTRKGLAAARARGATTGRPGMDDVPALKERIVVMRADGMTLQAIADRLNEEGVPTLRGGTEWRPSSVQAAAGYRRPHRPRSTGGRGNGK